MVSGQASCKLSHKNNPRLWKKSIRAYVPCHLGSRGWTAVLPARHWEEQSMSSGTWEGSTACLLKALGPELRRYGRRGSAGQACPCGITEPQPRSVTPRNTLLPLSRPPLQALRTGHTHRVCLCTVSGPQGTHVHIKVWEVLVMTVSHRGPKNQL